MEAYLQPDFHKLPKKVQRAVAVMVKAAVLHFSERGPKPGAREAPGDRSSRLMGCKRAKRAVRSGVKAGVGGRPTKAAAPNAAHAGPVSQPADGLPRAGERESELAAMRWLAQATYRSIGHRHNDVFRAVDQSLPYPMQIVAEADSLASLGEQLGAERAAASVQPIIGGEGRAASARTSPPRGSQCKSKGA